MVARTLMHRLVPMLVIAISSTGWGASDNAVAPPVPPAINLLVSFVWEGRDLHDHNILALRQFREAHPDLPITHFLSPAYFLKPGANPATVATRIRSLMRPGDKIGLSLGGWKSLATRANVIFRNGPTFWGHVLRPADCASDCGLEVPVHVYPERELRLLLDAALNVLEEAGFGRVLAMTTAGWVASPQLLEAAAQRGLRYDFSAVAPELIVKRTARFPLYGWTKGLWSHITPHTQPYVLATASAAITEIPQSLAAIDYLTAADITTLFEEYAGVARQARNRELTFPLVLYQETAAMSLPTLSRALSNVREVAARRGVELATLALPGMELRIDPNGTPSDPAAPIAH